MSLELKKSDTVINKTICEVSPQVLVDCDVIVPDSKPDVLKILQVDSNVVITSKDVRDGSIAVSGRMEYSVLYVPDDAKGVKSILATIPFNHIEEVSGVKSKMDISLSSSVEHIEFNLINSRKVSIKSIVGLVVQVSDKYMLETLTDITGDNVEIRYKNFKTTNTLMNTEIEVNINEQIGVPPGKPSVGELLKTDVSIINKDIKVINNKVVGKGELVICSLYTPEGEDSVTFMEHNIPFTEIMDVEGIREDLYNDITYYVKEATFAQTTDSDGDMRMIDAKVKLGVNVTSEEVISLSVVSDVYATDSSLELTTKYLEVNELQDVVKSQTTLREIIVAPEGIPDIVQVYNVITKPYISNSFIADGKVMIEGTIDTYILYITDKEDSPVHTFLYDIPYSVEMNSSADLEGSSVKSKIEVTHTSYNLNAAGEIEMRIIVSTSANIVKTVGVDMVSDAKELEMSIKDTPSIILYFVQKGDSLWDISKKYHTKIKDIMAANGLESDKIGNGMQLIIPKK